jgi:hypothetical protein
MALTFCPPLWLNCDPTGSPIPKSFTPPAPTYWISSHPHIVQRYSIIIGSHSAATYVVSKILAKKGEKPFNDGEKKNNKRILEQEGRYCISWFINTPDAKENRLPDLTLGKRLVIPVRDLI